MKTYYTIQEFSKITGEDVSRLRFYDKIGVFSPVKRDPENNYRYYSLAQIPTLNFIVLLSDLNVPLKQISNLRKERTPLQLLNLLEKQERHLDMEMRLLRERYSVIHARRELINYGTIAAGGFTAVDGKRVTDEDAAGRGVKVDESAVAVLYRENKEFHLWPRNEYGDRETFLQPLASFLSHASERHINLNLPIGGYWSGMDSFISEPSHPEHFFTIDPLGSGTRKEGEYLIAFNRGYYGNMGDMPERMAAYAKENALTLSGPVWVMYMFDEICTHDPSRYLAQACVAVSKPGRRRGVYAPAPGG
ncbi:MAG: MerR family transcriptional regulator [Oscillospiraceae bacterium]|nr:MerR family transcriptional regulator [Oscillospiraceae bacterium]